MVLTPILLGGILLYLLRWRLNVLAMGEEEARVLGINTTFVYGTIKIQRMAS
jgi:iron complex transport system permease protein